MKRMNQHLLATVFLLTTSVIWGFAFVAQVLGAEKMDPMYFNALRFALGCLSLIPVALLFERDEGKKDKAKSRRTLVAALVCGSILACAAALQQFGAQITMSPAKSGFITGIYTLLTPIISVLFFRRRVGWQVFGGALLAVGGLYLLCFEPGTGFSIGIGEAVLFIGAFFWAFHILAIDKFGRDIYPIRFSCMQFAVCAVLSAIPAVATEQLTIESIKGAGLAILFCGILSAGVGYTFQVLGQRIADPSYAAIIFSTESVFAAVGGIMFGQDELTLYGIIGSALIFGGIVFSQLHFTGKKKVHA